VGGLIERLGCVVGMRIRVGVARLKVGGEDFVASIGKEVAFGRSFLRSVVGLLSKCCRDMNLQGSAPQGIS